MLEFTRVFLKRLVLIKVFFKKELAKSMRWLNRQEVLTLKIWALTTFSQYKNTILEVLIKCLKIDFPG